MAKLPGFYENLPTAEYRADPALAYSDLSRFIDGAKDVSQAILDFGTLIHSLALEPLCTPITNAELDMPLAAAIADAWRSRPENMALLDGAFVESSIFWTSQGIPTKARLDIVAEGLVSDFKTTRSLALFMDDAERFGYFRQLAWYKAAAEAIMGGKFERCVLAAVEKTAPFASKIFEIPLATIETAARQNAINLALYKRQQRPEHANLGRRI